jgi:precorrin-2 methylase
MGITIVGLGPGNGRFLTRIAWDVLSQAEVVLPAHGAPSGRGRSARQRGAPQL